MIGLEGLLLGGLLTMLGMFTFRGFAPAAWLALAPSSTMRQRCIGGVLTVAACLVAVRWTNIDLLPFALGYVYLLALGSLGPYIADALRAGRVSSGAVFASWSLVFMILPAIYAPRACFAGLLVIGWDATLSAYSYSVEVARAPKVDESRTRRVEDCLFFLVVNPVLVYTARGSRVPPAAYGIKNAVRICVGLATLFGASVVIQPAYHWISSHSFDRASAGYPAAFAAASTVTVLASVAVLRLTFEYLLQSGVAHLQIGMVRQLGHDVPNRFDRPWLASSPMDFWRRWNMYVGAWVQRYVFWPVSLMLGRSSPFFRGARGKALAVLVSFGVVGLLHDANPYLKDLRGHYRGSCAFLVAGGLVIAFYGAEELASRASSRLRAVLRPWMGGLSIAAFWCTTLALFVWWDK